MQLSSASVSSSKRRNFNCRSGSRLRKKHKKLDAICEEEYNRNHNESNEGNGASRLADANHELRRSSRVRRAPVLLDASPPPPKKRRKIKKNVNLSVDKSKRSSSGSVKEETKKTEDLDIPGSWKSRLRSRRRNVGFQLKKETGASRRRRKLFEEMGTSGETENAMEREMEEKKGKTDIGKLMVVKSKRPGRVKALNSSGDTEEDTDIYEDKDDVQREEVERLCDDAENCVTVLERQTPVRNQGTVPVADTTEAVDNEHEVLNGEQSQKGCISNETQENFELSDNDVECGKVGEKLQDVSPVEANTLDEVQKEGGVHDGKGQSSEKLDEMPMEGEHAAKVDDSNLTSTDTLRKPRLKQGRRCGLCGGGTDGKPPKKLAHDTGDSDIEAYSGSSASEEPNYDIWDGFGDEPGWLGRLLGPINDRYGIAGIWVHQHCAVWSPEVYFAGLGCLKNVRAALCRGRALKCTRCGRPGATIGCRVDRCPKTYHLPCARANGCIFDHRKFLIACTDHRHLFQPLGNRYLARIKKMKAKKMKLEVRKLSNDASRKDIEAEEKWLENCGEDEEFLKRESKRLHRDLLRIAPVYIGGSDSDSGKPYEGWESVAGLQDVIQCMKEVVILPLLYPEFFDNLGLAPPRGVLLHGYPGTGKTLVVRALIGSCARGDKRIAYFARKGADCLGKYVGDAERQLRLLFQVAERCQPSIIFFDEIDGLAPRRTRQQDQTHSSVVSTLLALLDGLKSRGSVVVIGATNRPEAVDPALRRPGRFDREIYFPLPSMEDRAAILSLHTKKWPKPVTGSLLNWIARKTVGFAGADLQALCTQAAIIALKRNFPLQEVLSAAEVKTPGANRVPLPNFSVEERDWLEALSRSPPPCSRREAGIAANDLVSSPLPMHLVSCLLQPLSTLLVSLHLDERLWLPPTLSRAAEIVKNVIVSALASKNLPTDHWWFCVDHFLQEAEVAKEIERRLSYAGIVNGEACFTGSNGFCDDTGNDVAKFAPFLEHNGGSRSNVLDNIPFVSRKKSGFRILIAGSPRSGQRHLASCVLHCFVGNVEVQKVDLATMSQEGHGDVVQGVTHILMKCASMRSCVVFMPRIDLWALEAVNQFAEESDSSMSDHQSSEKGHPRFPNTQVGNGKDESSCKQQFGSARTSEPGSASQSVSHAWSSFVEQVESLSVSTSLMILATSEVPYQALPDRIRQFFKKDLSDSVSSTSLQMVPQFVVQVGENFNRDTAINLSAAELSRDMIQPYVHLIHQRTHVRENICKEYKLCTDEVHQWSGHGSVSEREDRSQLADDSASKVPPTPNNRTLKEKSSCLLAVSTFGYQLLLFPHFAELCWVTSKLREGPCADVSGPWRGWPFNSCIIRPDDSVENVACGSGNGTSKEKSGLVRGLIAVGLSAYRGIYTSPREVAVEVRRVLELLVGQINVKVNAGKDRYHYIRVLSQVAYLEDMVNSWAYALQSLNLDAQMEGAITELGTVESSGTHPCVDNPVLSDGFKPNVSDRSCLGGEALEENLKVVSIQNTDCVVLDRGKGKVDLNSEGRVGPSEEGLEEQIVLCGDNSMNLNGSGAAQPLGNLIDEHNETHLRPHELFNTGNLAPTIGEAESLKRSNGFTKVVVPENGLCDSAESNGFKVLDSVKESNGLPSLDGKADHSQNIDINFSSRETTHPAADPTVVCLYQCCSKCLYTLQGLMRNVLIHEWGLNRSDRTVEDVHDAVASLSAGLLSALSKVNVAGNGSNTHQENVRRENLGEFSEYPELSTCQCKGSGDSLVAPKECSCHSGDGCLSEAHTFPNSHFRCDPKFVFRDGALVPVDSMVDIAFHCKFDTVCLCSLIESIVMMKQPF